MIEMEMVTFEGIELPKKLIDYATQNIPINPPSNRPDFKLRTCMNMYKLFGGRPIDNRGRHDNKKLIQQNVQLIDKWTNVYIHRFTEDEVRRLVALPDKERELYLLMELERDLDGTVCGHSKRDIFDYFKPIINGFIDPAYILYNLATRRPKVYKIILETDGGFEWIKSMVKVVRDKKGMLNNPLMCEVWEMEAIMPSAKLLKES